MRATGGWGGEEEGEEAAYCRPIGRDCCYRYCYNTMWERERERERVLISSTIDIDSSAFPNVRNNTLSISLARTNFFFGLALVREICSLPSNFRERRREKFSTELSELLIFAQNGLSPECHIRVLGRNYKNYTLRTHGYTL